MAALPTEIRDCIYGASGTGKSESIARLIEASYRQTGKKARIAVGDGSAVTYEHLVRLGIAETYTFTMRPWPTATLKGLARGWWPNAQGKLAPTPPEVMAGIGTYVFEGMSVAARYLMGHTRGGMADRTARGERLGPDASMRIVEGEVDPKTGQVVNGTGEAYGTNGQAHYGYVQNIVLEVVQESHTLPVPYVLWTAHEATNNPETDLSKELVIGPEIIGKAMTANIQRSFNNSVHACTVSKRMKQNDAFTNKAIDELDSEYRLYTRDHFSPSGTSLTRYKAITRRVDGAFPQFFVAETPGDALLLYYQAVAAETNARAESLITAVASFTDQPHTT